MIAWELFEAWDVTKIVERSEIPYREPENLHYYLVRGFRPFDIRRDTFARTARSPLFTADTVLHGDPAAHPLLKPAQITTARYQPGRVEYECFIDQNRRAAGVSGSAAAEGVELLPEGATSRHAKPAADDRAERQRKRRAALKAAKVAKDTKENSNVRSAGRNGHQDPTGARHKHPSPATLQARERRRRKAFGLPLGKAGRPRHAKPSKAALYQRARRQRLRAKS